MEEERGEGGMITMRERNEAYRLSEWAGWGRGQGNEDESEG